MDWKRHEINIYDKILHWFEVIGTVLKDSAILPENVYNIDETGVMLCMLNSVEVLVSKDDRRGLVVALAGEQKKLHLVDGSYLFVNLCRSLK